MEQPVACYGVPPSVGSLPLEVGQAPARLLDEDERRREVPGVELRFEHRFSGALGHQRVAPEVAEPTVAPGGTDDGIETALLADGGEGGARGVEDLSVLELRDLRHAQASLTGPGAAPTHGMPALV